MEKEKTEISFQPLSAGLGFHPFSDGLPYAPVSPTNAAKPMPGSSHKAAGSSLPTGVSDGNSAAATASSEAKICEAKTSEAKMGRAKMGAGAIAAGPPTFVTNRQIPPAPIPRVSVPVAKAAAQVGAKKEEKPSPVKPQLNTEPKFGFLYLLRRSLAYVLDSCINMGLAAASFCLALWNQNLQSDLLFNSGVILVAGLFFFVFSWAIMTAQEIAFGTTLGKRIFGLSLHGSATAIFLRAFFFLPSLGFVGAGLLWSLVDRRRRCWHDLVVNLQPVDIAQS